MPCDYGSQRLSAIQLAGGFRPEVMRAFADFIAQAPEAELFRASPLRYAAAAGLEEREAIDLFLHATHAGILEFSWGVLCPGCVSFLTTPGGLRALAASRRCGFCQLDLRGSLDDNVEVAFTVAPSMRRLRFHDLETLDLRRDGPTMFFSSSLAPDAPLRRALAEQVVWAGRIDRGETREEPLALAAGPYVLVAPASHSVLHLDVESGAPPVIEADLLDGQAVPARARLAAGAARLRLRNGTPQRAGALLLHDPVLPPERRPPDARAPAHCLRPFLTGKRLIMSQAFRDLFRADSIPAEGGLALKSASVLFTDLKGSTELYERIGDLRAYDLVRQHFATLREAVAREGGALVKTIGDAIMASFAEPQPAMAAAIAMRRDIGRVGGGDLLLKIGLHAGPCIAVELNDRLDYFGRTVNVAARVQSLAEAREIVCTEAVYQAHGVDELCRAAALAPTRERAALKGIADEIPVMRLR